MATTTVPPVQPLTQPEIDQSTAALNTIVTQIAAAFTAYQNQIATLTAANATLTATNASQAATIAQLEGSAATLSIAAWQQSIQALSALANAGKTST